MENNTIIYHADHNNDNTVRVYLTNHEKYYTHMKKIKNGGYIQKYCSACQESGKPLHNKGIQF